jgi:hypothetical protein
VSGTVDDGVEVGHCPVHVGVGVEVGHSPVHVGVGDTVGDGIGLTVGVGYPIPVAVGIGVWENVGVGVDRGGVVSEAGIIIINITPISMIAIIAPKGKRLIFSFGNFNSRSFSYPRAPSHLSSSPEYYLCWSQTAPR